MPIWLRNFTYRKIEEHYRKLNSDSKAEKSWTDPKIQSQGKQEGNKITPPTFLKSVKPKTSYK
jgi:hypothetical protein|tara:strand:+ start:899 stop:1087 length:189 start_codon:yes stop_codon:yes gene_type:complete